MCQLVITPVLEIFLTLDVNTKSNQRVIRHQPIEDIVTLQRRLIHIVRQREHIGLSMCMYMYV